MALDRLRPLADWLAERPHQIHDLVCEWPPGCKVTSHEDAPLLIPAPGIVGEVVSWFEKGTIGVVAPMAETLTSPVTGNTATQGERIKGECWPAQLVLLGYGEYTSRDVSDALALLS